MKDIMLRIIGRQIDRNDEVAEETIEFMTEGKAYKKGDATYILSLIHIFKNIQSIVPANAPSRAQKIPRFI